MSRSLLGEDFAGTLVTDCYSAYDAQGAKAKQKCLSHLARTARDWLLARYWKRMGQYGRVFTSDDGALLRNYEQRGILRGR